MVDGNGSTTHKEGLSPKTFAKGDLVVYPNHGAGTVSGIEEKTIPVSNTQQTLPTTSRV
jgi:hypothetical protein